MSSAASSFPYHAIRSPSHVDANLTSGGRIAIGQKSHIRLYIMVGIAVLLTAGALYFFFLVQKENDEIRGFDPNRPLPSDTVLRLRLMPTEYHVVREGGTDTPFQNEFWNNERPGIYVDVITGEPLFTSLDKFKSDLGMPAFSKAISKDLLVEKLDTSNDMQRTELRSKRSNAHLGHLFPDSTSPTGQRYFINSSALHFIPIERMKDENYEAYLPLLKKK
jgi:peptide-methionine (R)-S-oxide reductase